MFSSFIATQQLLYFPLLNPLSIAHVNFLTFSHKFSTLVLIPFLLYTPLFSFTKITTYILIVVTVLIFPA